MSKFNQYMNSHFAGCQLLAEGFDLCRNREVRVFMIPGYHVDVGFSDGTDAWIVPIAAESCTGAGNLLKGINLREMMGRILNGEPIKVQRGAEIPKRRRLADDEPVVVAEPPRSRRRVALEEQTQPAPRRRHVEV